jgi:hypothetical protein
MHMFASGWGRPVRRLLLLLLLCVLAGCGGSGQVSVSGKVLFNGGPLPGGLITFRPVDPQLSPASAMISEEGTYEAIVPIGEVEVSIDNRGLEPPPPGPESLPGGLLGELSPEAIKGLKMQSSAPPAPKSTQPGRYVEIPERYYDPDTSMLKFRVEHNGQQHDFQLAK